ncbi:MAG: DUF1846 domain-containing protein [Candidatus Omnitrophica bacterium]|nr:DUF1846 domain-containing protein [Candidatus Omnitrophota bacterium]
MQTQQIAKKNTKETEPISSPIGFDHNKYLEEQTKFILERVKQAKDRLYLEFGGKIICDYHASRVLPGFSPDVKIQLLQKLKDKAEIILCIYAGDIERKKVRADFGITYDIDALRMIDELRERGLDLAGIVITRFANQPSATIFKNKLERRGIKVYTHPFTKGYPTSVDLIVSEEGYGANKYIKTSKPLVIVTGPGPGSGKLATCLSQLYHEHKKGLSAGYSKFETFPIWNLPLKHPVNIAYEAATVDLKDVNMVDPFHLEAYNKVTINYNRDIEAFPLLKRILQRIVAENAVYKSPTDMGVNRAGFGIFDDKVVQEAAKQEIIRRYFRYACEHVMGFTDKDSVERAALLVEEIGLKPEDRTVVLPARKAAQEAEVTNKTDIFCGAALQLHNRSIVTGKNSPLMHAASSVVLNAIKTLAEIPDKIHLLSPSTIGSIGKLKTIISNTKILSLNVEETLIALSISATTNPTAQLAMEKLKELKGCDMHLSHMPTPGDEAGLRKLGVHLTCDPIFSSNNLYLT